MDTNFYGLDIERIINNFCIRDHNDASLVRQAGQLHFQDWPYVLDLKQKCHTLEAKSALSFIGKHLYHVEESKNRLL